MSENRRLELTSRDFEILEVLTQRVRVLSLEQIARTWWATSPNGPKLARERRKLLAKDSLVDQVEAAAHPELPLSKPVLTWSPGAAEPDLGSASYQLQSRWRASPKPTLFNVASKKAGNRFGGHGGRMPLGTHRTHDLHMAAVFLLLRRSDPDTAKCWVFEERLRRDGRSKSEKLPDAMIQNGTSRKVVEFGGAYSKKKLEVFHGYCAGQELPYEVW
jgi:hypothetical protein